MTDCPKCGQKLRPKWTRCPRCRALVGETTGTSESVSPDSGKRVSASWLAAAGGVALAALMSAAVLTRDSSPPSPVVAGTTAAPTAAPTEAIAQPAIDGTSAAVTTPSSAETNFAAVDARRTAQAAYASGDYATALTALEEAVKAAPADPDAHNNLGQVLVRQGRAADALPHFDEAVRLVGTRWDYRFNRARAHGLLDRWTEAVADYRVAAQLFPGDHATLYNLGLALIRVKDYAGAASALEQAVTAAPDQHDFLISLGTAYIGAEQSGRARATFEKFLQVAPNDADVPKVKALLQSLVESAP